MTDICIILLNITILLVYLTNKNNYKILNEKIKHLENDMLDQSLMLIELCKKHTNNIISAIEDGTLKKNVKTKKKN